MEIKVNKKYKLGYDNPKVEEFAAWIENAADTALTERFLRMGIDELSMSPVHILKLREAVRNIDLSKDKKPRTKEILKDSLK